MSKSNSHSGMSSDVVWSGWACQYPGSMPRLYGEKKIAELNHDPENGDKILFVTARVLPGKIKDKIK